MIKTKTSTNTGNKNHYQKQRTIIRPNHTSKVALKAMVNAFNTDLPPLHDFEKPRIAKTIDDALQSQVSQKAMTEVVVSNKNKNIGGEIGTSLSFGERMLGKLNLLPEENIRKFKEATSKHILNEAKEELKHIRIDKNLTQQKIAGIIADMQHSKSRLVNAIIHHGKEHPQVFYYTLELQQRTKERDILVGDMDILEERENNILEIIQFHSRDPHVNKASVLWTDWFNKMEQIGEIDTLDSINNITEAKAKASTIIATSRSLKAKPPKKSNNSDFTSSLKDILDSCSLEADSITKKHDLVHSLPMAPTDNYDDDNDDYSGDDDYSSNPWIKAATTTNTDNDTASLVPSLYSNKKEIIENNSEIDIEAQEIL